MDPKEMSLKEIIDEVNELMDRDGFYDDPYYDSALLLVDIFGITYQVKSIKPAHENEPLVIGYVDLLAIPQGTTCSLEIERDWLEAYLLKVRQYCKEYSI